MTDEEATLATREWFAENALACIDDAKSGRVHVNNLERYVEWQHECMRAALAGENDHTFTFRQRRQFIQTGRCDPLLAPVKDAA